MTASAGLEEKYGTFKIGKLTLSKPVVYTYALAVLYNVSFFLQFSTMPYLMKGLKLTDTQMGYVGTIFGIFQMVGSPFFGYIIQKFGLHTALLLCYASTLLSGVFLFFSSDLTTLILSRIPVVFMHGQQSHQTLLSALTQPGEQRTVAFGRLGLTFGLGFIFTPLLSLASTRLISENAPLMTSAFVCLVTVAVMETCIPKEVHDYHDAGEASKTPDLTVTNVAMVLRKPGVFNVLLRKNVPLLPFFLMISVLNIYMIEKFNATNEQNQMIQMSIGIFIMFANGFGVLWLRQRFEEQTLLLVGISCFIVGYSLFSFFYSLWMILVIMPFICMGTSIVATVADSMLTSLVEDSEQGIILGLATSLNSLIRTFAPLFGGYIQQNYSFFAIPAIGVALCTSGFFYAFLNPIDERILNRKTKKSE